MPRWTDISPEPNSPAAKRYRLATLKKAWHPPVVDRIAYLKNLAQNKRVLDVGVVAHTAANEANEEWLHRAIAQSAAYCLGVDILEADVQKLQAAGYNVRLADITRDDLGEKFDLVIVGEVIEHLGSPESLFAAAHRLLLPGGRMVLTTPNPYYWKQIRNSITRRRKRCESVDHVSLLFPSGIAELTERANLQFPTYRGIWKGKKNRPAKGLPLALKKLVAATLTSPDLFCETLIYECVL